MELPSLLARAQELAAKYLALVGYDLPSEDPSHTRGPFLDHTRQALFYLARVLDHDPFVSARRLASRITGWTSDPTSSSSAGSTATANALKVLRGKLDAAEAALNRLQKPRGHVALVEAPPLRTVPPEPDLLVTGIVAFFADAFPVEGDALSKTIKAYFQKSLTETPRGMITYLYPLTRPDNPFLAKFLLWVLKLIPPAYTSSNDNLRDLLLLTETEKIQAVRVLDETDFADLSERVISLFTCYADLEPGNQQTIQWQNELRTSLKKVSPILLRTLEDAALPRDAFMFMFKRLKLDPR